MNGDTPIVLVVEDDALLRGAFVMLLDDAGISVREAGSVKAALDSVAEIKPDLIVLDVGLPDRPGTDVARILKADSRTADIHIFALTGHAGGADRAAAMDAGCDDYFVKPVSPRELLRRIREHLT